LTHEFGLLRQYFAFRLKKTLFLSLFVQVVPGRRQGGPKVVPCVQYQHNDGRGFPNQIPVRVAVLIDACRPVAGERK
jgi:hypothetical protein